jgi:hypothetical protein
MKVIAIRYFIAKRDSMIDMESKESLIDIVQNEVIDEERKLAAKMDIERLLSLRLVTVYVRCHMIMCGAVTKERIGGGKTKKSMN